MTNAVPKSLALAVIMTAVMAAPAPAVQTDEIDRLTTARSGDYGAYVADNEGRALYMFEPDQRGRGAKEAGSTCYGACAEAWPPALAEDMPDVTGRLDKNLLGTIKRKDGSIQITYGGWPLYYYVKDRGPGSVTGQDVHGFGGGWYLVGPDGKEIKKEKKG